MKMQRGRLGWVVGSAAAAGVGAVMLLGGAGVAAANAAATAPATNLAAPAPFEVDGAHSSVVFRVKHMNVAYFYGRFNKVSGSFLIDKDNLAASTITATIDAESVDTAIPDRDKHLRSQDFFSVKEFPAITFKSTSIEKGAGENQFTLKGELTFRGVTKPIEAKLEHTGVGPGRRGGEVGGFEAIFTIKRAEFGMDYMLNGLSDDVNITVSLEGKRN